MKSFDKDPKRTEYRKEYARRHPNKEREWNRIGYYKDHEKTKKLKREEMARRRHKNPEAVRAYHREWERNNPDKMAVYAAKKKERYKQSAALRRQRKHTELISRFGISIEEYEAMVLEQDNRCAICREAERRFRHGNRESLTVDHCHTTKEVRALLCSRCNLALGACEQFPGFFAAAEKYLNHHASRIARISSAVTR